jgi:SAM-dependent methyltransferase
MQTKNTWYQNWFDTPFYHQLYNYRDNTEAERFMLNLMSFLQLPEKSRILDMPCGKGRHSVFLNKLGYRVYGADLSGQSIAYAKRSENEGLHFFEQDMLVPLSDKYDLILNLFTSFGYFDESENLSVLQNFVKALNPGGLIVIDFLNIKRIQNNLVKSELIKRDGIIFNISRNIVQDDLIKKIRFTTEGKDHEYEERVKCIDLEKFTEMAESADLKIKRVFGDYDLNPYEEENSERLIIVFK